MTWGQRYKSYEDIRASSSLSLLLNCLPDIEKLENSVAVVFYHFQSQNMRCLLSTYLNVVIGNSDGFFISAQISSKFDRSLSNLGISVGGHLFFQNVLKIFFLIFTARLKCISKI